MIMRAQQLSEQRQTLMKIPPQSQMNIGQQERIGSAVAGLALIAFALQRRPLAALISAAAGVALLARGASGRCSMYKKLGINTAQRPAPQSENIVRGEVTIQRSPEELYRLWREPQNFVTAFEHFAKVEVISEKESHWTIELPTGKQIQWNSWITEEQPGQWIRWESSQDSQFPNRGRLSFKQAPGDKGSELSMELQFEPPVALGTNLARIMGMVPKNIAVHALRRFKSLIETGEVPKINPQPHSKNKGGAYESPRF